MDPRVILLNILTVIEYQDDKNVFIEDYLKTLSELAMAKMIATLAPEAKQKLEEELKDVTDPVLFQQTIQTYFPKDAFEKELEQVSKETFADYLETIYPTLSLKKQKELDAYLSTLQPK